eukprot:2447488-Alexandrium_andersonii.AAC.1
MGEARSKLEPQSGRKVVEEEVPGARDWKTFFADLQMDVHGHARAPAMRRAGVDAARCFRFVRRRRLHEE